MKKNKPNPNKNQNDNNIYNNKGLLAANDGSGAITVSLLIPIISKAWDVSPEMKSVLTTFIFIGFAVGSFVGGTLSDKYGRKILLKNIVRKLSEKNRKKYKKIIFNF